MANADLFSTEPSTDRMVEAFPPPGYRPTPSKLEGIEIYMPASTTEEKPELVDFKCPKCGATTAYSVDARGLHCEHCGYSETPDAERLGRAAEKFEFRVETLQRVNTGWGEERKDLACQRCGGVVSVPPDALAFSCPFCGSNKVIFRASLEDILRPRYLIPFKVDPAGCKDITCNWLGASWMIPGDLKAAAQNKQAGPEKFHPLYIPYWTFNARANAAWSADVGHQKTEHYTENGQHKTRTVTEWRRESGRVERDFFDVLVPGTAHLNMKTLGQVDAFDIRDLVLYEPRYLAGMQAQTYDIPLDDAWDAGRQLMRDRTRKACLDRASTSQVRNFQMTLDFEDESWRYILAPVYTSVYNYRDEPYQILINGQTGKIAGPRPVDWGKVWLVVALLLAPGLLVALYGIITGGEKGQGIMLGGLFFLFIGVVIDFFLLSRAQEMEHV